MITSKEDFELKAMTTGVPEHDIDALWLYFNDGIEPGSFLCAVLENNLMESMGRADMENRLCLFKICQFIYMYMPSVSHGSREKVISWMKRFRETDIK
jgi:hypothetical protein